MKLKKDDLSEKELEVYGAIGLKVSFAELYLGSHDSAMKVLKAIISDMDTLNNMGDEDIRELIQQKIERLYGPEKSFGA